MDGAQLSISQISATLECALGLIDDDAAPDDLQRAADAAEAAAAALRARAARMMAQGHGDAKGGQAALSTRATTESASPPPSLTGIAVVRRAFLFLDGRAEVLRASTANHRWRELATADSVWRVKAKREGMVEKAGVFEVALPSVAAEEEDEAAGVGLAFYAAVFVLKVWLA